MRSLAQTQNRPELHANMSGEYNSLKVVYDNKEKLQNGLGAIRPLLHLEPLNAIVMEERSSVTLGRMISDWRTAMSGSKEGLASLLDAAFKTGQWLHAFHHTIHTSHEVEFSAEEFMKEVNDLAVRLETASRKTISAGFICELFSKNIHRLEFKRAPCSITHGDMTCDNVLYTSEKTVFVVDIKSKPAVVYSDLGIILIHPETFKAQVLTLGLFIRRNVLKEYQKAVLEGYFGNNPADEALLNLYCAMNFLDKWATYEDVFYKLKGIKRLITWFIAPVFRLYFLAHIKKYLASR
jgi:thiamine kinase-like enzyme